jgi:transposase
MSEKKRQSFSADFKAKVALEAIHSVKTLNEISQEYGVHPVQVSTWKKELQQQASTLFVQKDFGTLLNLMKVGQHSLYMLQHG